LHLFNKKHITKAAVKVVCVFKKKIKTNILVILVTANKKNIREDVC